MDRRYQFQKIWKGDEEILMRGAIDWRAIAWR